MPLKFALVTVVEALDFAVGSVRILTIGVIADAGVAIVSGIFSGSVFGPFGLATGSAVGSAIGSAGGVGTILPVMTSTSSSIAAIGLIVASSGR